MFRVTILIVLLGAVIKVSGQEKTLLTLNMKNGDVISGYSDISMIPFSTEYGNLAFPVEDVKNLVLGINSDGIDRDELYSRLDKIRFGTLEESERAFDRLVAADERILPMMRDYMTAPDYERKLYYPYTVELLYSVLLEKFNLSDDFPEEDIIYFNEDHSIRGAYKFDNIQLESEYGNFLVERHDIAEIQIRVFESDYLSSKSFKLLADQHITANRKDGWLKTGILVKTGDLLSIISEGEITLESLDGNTYTPDGGVNGSPPPKEEGPLFGNVVFKVGEKGPLQVAGNSINERSELTGIIYLSIYESVYNSGNKGHYIAKIKIEDYQ